LHYHSIMPFEYIVQQLVYYPVEVSVFYIRHPKEEKGIVTGFLHKIPIAGNRRWKTYTGRIDTGTSKRKKQNRRVTQ